MDYRNKLDGSDKNIVIYGHNTMDGTMFGTLRNVVKENWYKNTDNHIINLVLEDKVLKAKESAGSLNSYLVETIDGIETIKNQNGLIKFYPIQK